MLRLVAASTHARADVTEAHGHATSEEYTTRIFRVVSKKFKKLHLFYSSPSSSIPLTIPVGGPPPALEEGSPYRSLHNASMSQRHGVLKFTPVVRSKRGRDSTPVEPLQNPLIASNPLSIAFGPADWKKHFGMVEDVALPPNVEQILSGPCPSYPGKKMYEVYLLVFIPQMVNGQPLTLSTLEQLVAHPLQGYASQYRGFFPDVHVDQPASMSHWMLVTRDVIPGSRGKNYENQQAALADYSQKVGIQHVVPTILDATVAIFTEYVRSGTKLYEGVIGTYTRCQEEELLVGGFADDGLLVDHHTIHFASEFIGVGGSIIL